MSKHESADLILKLYDLRREATMREARTWFFGFVPKSADEVMAAMMNPETSARFRMVASYWDMAASLVIHDAIDPEMFADTNGEHVFVYAKLEPFLAELREKTGSPRAYANLEKVINDMPNGQERVAYAKAVIERMTGQSAASA